MAKPKETIETIEAEYVYIQDDKPEEETLPPLTEEQAKALKPIVERFMASYAKKPKKMSDAQWLNERLGEELPEKSKSEIQKMSREILSEVRAFDENLASLNAAAEKGQPKETWLADKMQDAAIGVNVNDYGNYLQRIDDTLAANNEAMMQAIRLKDQSGISMNPNLDGFMAEQEITNSFNREAALKNSPYRADVLRPEGAAYGKNSVDIVIRDTRKAAQNIVKRYQVKYGKDASSTARYLERGDYRGQQSIVPKGQKQGVRNKVSPTKQVNDYIESPDGVRSKPVSKEQMKNRQGRVQSGKNLRKDTWNAYNTRELALNLGKQAAVAGLAGAALGTGFHLAAKVFQGEEIKAEEVIEPALVTGADTGVKAAATGALKVGVEKGVVPLLAKGTPIGVLATVACVGIENAKIMLKFAKGEIGGMKALDLMARTSTAMTAGLYASGVAMAKGAALGASALSFLPVAGPIIGGIIGGTVGYIAGSKVGNAIYSGIKKIGNTAKSAAKGAWNGLKSGVSKAWNSAKSFVSSLFG